MARPLVLILDFGYQYTQLIARRVRELGVFSEILPGSATLEEIEQHRPDALILPGRRRPATAPRSRCPTRGCTT
jgi:GMP synthase (glutamine-hydrolysing)